MIRKRELFSHSMNAFAPSQLEPVTSTKNHLAYLFKRIELSRKCGEIDIKKILMREINKPSMDKNLILQYIEYERFLDSCYDDDKSLMQYNNAKNLIGQKLSDIVRIENQVSWNPKTKRLIYDGLVDATIHHFIKESRTKNSTYNPSFIRKLQLAQNNNCFFVDIIINSLGRISGKSSILESHFQLLYSLCHALTTEGFQPRIILIGLPFSGFGWPMGDPTTGLTMNECENFASLFHDISNNLLIQPEIICFNYDSRKSWIENVYNTYMYLKNRDKRSTFFEIDFGCISGSFLSHLPRSSQIKRSLLAACSNNRFFNVNSEVDIIMGNNPDKIITSKRVTNKYLRYFPLISKSNLRQSSLKKIQAQLNYSLATCFIVSNYMGLVCSKLLNQQEIYEHLRGCNIVLIGQETQGLNRELFNVYPNLICNGFEENLPGFFSHIYSSIPRSFVLVPFEMTGMATSILLAAINGIPFIASNVNDACSYIDKKHFCKNRREYIDSVDICAKTESYDRMASKMALAQGRSFKTNSKEVQDNFRKYFLNIHKNLKDA